MPGTGSTTLRAVASRDWKRNWYAWTRQVALADDTGQAAAASDTGQTAAASETGSYDHGQRRTPGLRRQEVAQLGGISVDYYIRMEQARGPRPSRQVLSALARALMLTADERDYLFRVAGESPPQVTGPSHEITPGLRHLLDGMPGTPAYVVDAACNVLAWNHLATHFIGDLSGYDDRNMIRWSFTRVILASTAWSPRCSCSRRSSRRCGRHTRSRCAGRCSST